MKLFARAPIKFGAGLFACLFIAVALLLLAPATPAHAQDIPPAIGVITKTEYLATSATSFTIPVVITQSSGASPQASAVGFVLQYITTCVSIRNVGTDVSLGAVSAPDHIMNVLNNGDLGKLWVSISEQNSQANQTAFVTGNLVTIKFTLEPGCLTPVTTTFSFDAANTSFGGLTGAAIGGTAVGGTYTLVWNTPPHTFVLAPSSVPENVSGTKVIGLLSATDDDGDSSSFALATGCTAYNNDGFSVATNTLSTDRAFDYDGGVITYPVCVQANDGRGGVSAATLVTVTVTSGDDPPTWIELSGNTLIEGSALSTTIGTLTTQDDDVGQTTHIYSLVDGAGAQDNASFAIHATATNRLVANKANTAYASQSLYRVRIRSTDPVSASLYTERSFTIRILGKAVLSLPGQPEVPYVVVAGSAVNVPVRYSAKGNNVVTATVVITYNRDCLTYNGFTPLVEGFTDEEEDVVGTVTLTMSHSSGNVLREGVIGNLNFAGKAACNPGRWTLLNFTDTPVLKEVGNVTAGVATPINGQLVVMAELPEGKRGDCNSSGALEAGDFSAIAIEHFDIEKTAGDSLPDDSWLWTPAGTYPGNALGCDANADYKIAVSDITCAARRFFQLTCATTRDGRTQAAQIAAPASLVAAPGSAVAAPVILTANGNAIAAAAFTMQIDPALVFDATDANADGVPDAVSFNTPAGFFNMVLYDAPTRRLQVLVAGLVMPLPVLPDGAFATIQLQGAASANGGAAPIVLSDVSLGSVEGNEVEVVVAPLGMANRVFLPSVKR